MPIVLMPEELEFVQALLNEGFALGTDEFETQLAQYREERQVVIQFPPVSRTRDTSHHHAVYATRRLSYDTVAPPQESYPRPVMYPQVAATPEWNQGWYPQNHQLPLSPQPVYHRKHVWLQWLLMIPIILAILFALHIVTIHSVRVWWADFRGTLPGDQDEVISWKNGSIDYLTRDGCVPTFKAVSSDGSMVPPAPAWPRERAEELLSDYRDGCIPSDTHLSLMGYYGKTTWVVAQLPMVDHPDYKKQEDWKTVWTNAAWFNVSRSDILSIPGLNDFKDTPFQIQSMGGTAPTSMPTMPPVADAPRSGGSIAYPTEVPTAIVSETIATPMADQEEMIIPPMRNPEVDGPPPGVGVIPLPNPANDHIGVVVKTGQTGSRPSDETRPKKDAPSGSGKQEP